MHSDIFVARILGECDSVQSLTIWAYTHPGNLVGVQQALKSLKLSPTQISFFQFFLSPDTPSKRTFAHSIFSQVTHLDVTCLCAEGEWFWPSLKKLDSLTHLSVDVFVRGRKPDEITKDILRYAPQGLRILVISLRADEIDASFLRSLRSLARGDLDPRVVVLHLGTRPIDSPDANFEMSFDDLLQEWGYPSLGSKLWTLAEQVVETRQSELADSDVRALDCWENFLLTSLDDRYPVHEHGSKLYSG